MVIPTAGGGGVATPWPSQRTQPGNIHVHITLNTHIHVNVSFYAY